MNTSLRFADGQAMTTVHPTWDWECPFGQVCQAGSAVLSGKAAIGYSLTGYDTSSSGFVSHLFHPGDGATWNVLGAPAGSARLSLRYSNTVSPIVAIGSQNPGSGDQRASGQHPGGGPDRRRESVGHLDDDGISRRWHQCRPGGLPRR